MNRSPTSRSYKSVSVETKTPYYGAMKRRAHSPLFLDRTPPESPYTIIDPPPLHQAVLRYSDAQVLALLERGENINQRDEDGNTCLHISVRFNIESIFTLLLMRNADVNVKGKNGRTPLHYSILSYNEKFTEQLLGKGARIDVEDDKQETPLHLSVVTNSEPHFQLLLEKGCQTNVRDRDGNTALHVGVKRGNKKFVRKLLEFGADPNVVNEYAETPLHYAIKIESESLVKLLVAGGAQLDKKVKRGESYLHFAVNQQSAKMIKVLLDRGIDIDIKDDFGQSPLFDAVDKNDGDIISLLLSRGASVNARNDTDSTPLHGAVLQGFERSVRILLDAGAEIESSLWKKRICMVNFTADDVETPLRIIQLVELNNRVISLGRMYDMLKEHLIKLTTANLKVSVTEPKILDFTEHKEFQALCSAELEKMTSFISGISIYDVLSKTQDPTIAGNQVLEHLVNSEDLELEFPLYAAIIRSKFIDLRKRYDLFTTTELYIGVPSDDGIREIHLPYIIKKEIFCFLSNDNLDNLKKAYDVNVYR